MIYDYLFIGATTLACAWAEEAERAGRRCAVLESAGLVGYDYAESWRADPVDRADCPDEARGLLDELTARVVDNFEIDEETARRDVNGLTAEMIQKGMVLLEDGDEMPQHPFLRQEREDQ